MFEVFGVVVIFYVVVMFLLVYVVDCVVSVGCWLWMNSLVIYILLLLVYCLVWMFYGVVGYVM